MPTTTGGLLDVRRSVDFSHGRVGGRASIGKHSFSLAGKKRTTILRALQGLDALTSARRGSYRHRKPGYYLHIFRKAAKFLIVFLGLWRKHVDKVNEFLQSNVRMVTYHKADDVLFDVTSYRSRKECRISVETARILSTDPNSRSERDIHLVVVSLRNYPSIAACPVRMQTLIAERGLFSRFVGRRIIIRQGHVARNFYFILSGSVIITRMERNSLTSHTLCYLKRGDSFGELALNNNVLRSASAISDGTVELLIYNETDYWKIFRFGGVHSLDDPIFKSAICLKNWPIKHLLDNEDKAIIFFFRRGHVIEKDIQNSTWIYFIKSGTCTLLKKILVSEINEKRSNPESKLRKSKQSLKKLNLREHEKYITESLHALNIHNIPDKKENVNYENDKELFISVQTYDVGDVFGLASLVHGDSVTSDYQGLSFVSNGAECLMVDKKLFMSFTTATSLQMLRSQIRPYPKKSQVLHSYVERGRWMKHKQSLSLDVINRSSKHSRPMKSFK